MALSLAELRLVVDTTELERGLAELVGVLSPLLWRISLHQQRHRSRVVTRRKQRHHR